MEDQPEAKVTLDPVGPLRISPIVFGAATLSHHYNSESYLSSDTPLRTIRLALKYGVRAFDTSPYYGKSEIVLGAVLEALRDEFPRSSYQLMTKCGRYGGGGFSFDYSPQNIRASVKRSLERLRTDYLDVVYLHDVEFVCERVGPRNAGNHLSALATDKGLYGLAEGDEGKVWGPRDQIVLDAFVELRKLKEEGLVKNIGISGFPLPTLLRLALLILHAPPHEPLDVVLSYSHLTLQNASLAAFAPAFRARARVRQPLAASPLSMGLLTPSPPAWHPAPEGLRLIVAEAAARTDLPSLALGFSLRSAAALEVPLLVGLSDVREVHECMRVLAELKGGSEREREDRKAKEDEIRVQLDKGSFLDWSWACPPE